MQSGKTERFRVNGSIGDDGAMRCRCGKKLGQASAEGVSLICRGCDCEVDFSVAKMKLAILGQIAAHVAAI